MVSAPGYRKTKDIYESKRILVYQAVCENSGKNCVIKIANDEFPPPEIINRFNKEFALVEQCNANGIVPYVELGKIDERPFIVMEDIGAITIKEYWKGKTFNIKDFLKIAIAISKTLKEIHSYNIIHKDINPNNILIVPETGAIHIIDFEIASQLGKEIIQAMGPENLEGTLRYMAPEQTGRINRSTDFRSDFYALGITFYEILCSKAPFESNDLMELVHAHVAKEPEPIAQLNTNVPDVLSRIILKLIEKSAHDRYQSINGLIFDLEFVNENIHNADALSAFRIAENDVSSVLQIPEKLYGREHELNILHRNLLKAQEGQNILQIVTGKAGVGKTELLFELQKKVLELRGFFALGTCEKSKQEIPFFPLIIIFKALIKQLLAEPEHIIAHKKDVLTEQLNDNGYVLTHLIPELEILIGKQKPVEALGAVESQNRLTEVFITLIDFFGQIANPLVFIFDDMQWVDKSTLLLLQSLIFNDTYKHLFLIGSFKHKELESNHLLLDNINTVKQKGRFIDEINLKNIKQHDISHLLAETLKLPVNEVESLSAIIFNKTAGNPFFVKEFIKQIAAEELLVFNPNKGQWDWDTERITHLNITDNVAALMEEKLLFLPKHILRLLKDAACIGKVFSINTLLHLSKKRWSVIKEEILQIINDGFIIPLHNFNDLFSIEHSELNDITFQFQHGRMLDVVYGLLTEKERAKKHLLIAKYLNKINENATDEILIEITNHYNRALSILSKKEKGRICELNYTAGRYIKETSAYDGAINYFYVAKNLLPDKYWKKNNEFASSLFIEIGECEYLLGNNKKAEELFTETYEQTIENVQKLRVVNSQISQYIHQASFNKAIDIAVISLTSTNENISSTSGEEIENEINIGFNQLNHFLDNHSLDSLLDNISTDETQILTTSILSSILESSFMIGRINLTILAALKIIKYCIENGVNKNAALGFAYFGTFYNTMYSNLEKGYVFGNFAVQLGQQIKNPKSFHKVLVLHGFMCSYIKEPLTNSIQILSKAFTEAKQNGDYAFANYALSDDVIVNHLMGNKISSTQLIIEKYNPFLNKAAIALNIELMSMFTLILKAYKSKTNNSTELTQTILEHYEKSIAYFKSINYWAGIGIVQIIVSEFLFINKNFKQALQIIEQNTNVKKYLKGFANEIAFYFYYSLAICKNYKELNTENKEKNKSILADNIMEIKKYADANPSNFMHFYALANAEFLQLENKNWEAIENYELAIQNASNSNNLTIKALANELMAHFYLNKSNNKVYKTYIDTAYYNYQQCENYYKVRQLETENSFFTQKTANLPDSETSASYSTINISHSDIQSRNFDLTTAIKFAQSISQEVNLDKLLTKTISIILENAGASSGCLLLCTDGNFYIEAEAHAHNNKVTVLQNTNINSIDANNETNYHLAIDVVNYVIRTHEVIVLNNALADTRFQRSQYLHYNKVKSVLCLPIIKQGNLSSILYLENRLAENVFTTEHLHLLKHLSSQISISIDNARLYENLENKIALRTQEVVSQKTEIEAAYMEQQKQKEELQHFAKQLELANQTKDKFFSIIAHDLRSPFGALLNLSELLYYKYDNYDEERRKYFIKKLNETSEHTFELLQNLLTWSLSQNNTIDFEPQYYSINELIDKAMSVVDQLAREKNIELLTECQQEEVAFVDKNMILTVIRNLLSNAIKFTPEKGKVMITCIRSENGNIKISVTDSGIGMTKEQIENLFELNKKNTTLGTNKEKGTGLGLLLCKDFIERNEGKLFVDSTLQKGSVFSFTLPFK